LGQPIKAIDALERYLEEGGTQIPANEKETATTMIQEEKKKVGVLVLKVERDGVEAKVDGEVIGTSPFDEMMLMPGPHQVAVRFGEHDIVTRSIELEGGEELLLRIQEEKHAAAPAAPVSEAEEETEEEPSRYGYPPDEEEDEEVDEGDGEGSLVPFYISAVVAGVGLVGGGIGFGFFLHYNASEKNYAKYIADLQANQEEFADFTWEETCSSQTVDSEPAEHYCNKEINRRDFEKRKGQWLIIGAVGAGVFGLALVPTILFAVNRHWFADDGEDENVAGLSLTPVIGPDQRGLMLNLSF
jgi:hypothetical protein